MIVRGINGESMTSEKDQIAIAKQQLRQRLREIRNSLEPSWVLEASRAVHQRLVELPEYLSARIVMSYVSVGKEVETHQLLLHMQKEGKTVVIPWCEGRELRLFRWESLDELECGALNILEPRLELRSRQDKHIGPECLDLVLVPGLGFDPNGNRLGRGGGYYDRFLKTTPRKAFRIGLGFECQIVEAIPMSANDEKVDLVITECHTYRPEKRR